MRGEINEGIAVGVSALEILGTDFFPAQENRGFVRERHTRGDHVVWRIRLQVLHDARRVHCGWR